MRRKPRSMVLFSTGMGDSLQLLPLCRTLMEEGHEVTGVFSSACPAQEIIAPLGILDKIQVIDGSGGLFTFALRNTWYFDHAFIEHSGSSWKNCLMACLSARKTVTNRQKWYLRLLPNLTIRKPLGEAHLLLQNLHLALINKKLGELDRLCHIDSKLWPSPPGQVTTWGSSFIVVQLCAANNSVDYKNWPLENWALLFKSIRNRLPAIPIVLIGDKNEIAFGQAILDKGIEKVYSIIGKTSLLALAKLLSNATLYLGLDSGSMHLAAMQGTPTFNIWGPTDPLTLGYEAINAKKHRDICATPPCHPCKSWIRPNTSLFDNPLKCPHRNCINSLGAVPVIQAFWEHWERLFPDKTTTQVENNPGN